MHHPGKVFLDIALATALGGNCLADVAMLRAELAVFGLVAPDPTVSRLIDALAAAGPKTLSLFYLPSVGFEPAIREIGGPGGSGYGCELVAVG